MELICHENCKENTIAEENHGPNQKEVKVDQVSFADALPGPNTVVVVAVDADVAIQTMIGIGRPYGSTFRTQPFIFHFFLKAYILERKTDFCCWVSKSALLFS